MEEKILEPEYIGRKTDVNGFLGDTAYTELRKYDEVPFSKYNYSTNEQDSNGTYTGGIDYASGLPCGLSEEQYFQLILMDKLDNITSQMGRIADSLEKYTKGHSVTSALLEELHAHDGETE